MIYKCPVCSKTFCELQGLLFHFEQKHERGNNYDHY